VNRNIRALCVCFLLCTVSRTSAFEEGGPGVVCRRIADRIISRTLYSVVDGSSGQILEAENLRTVSASARLGSEYNDWAYFYGVMLSGMLRAGEILKEPAYTEYAVRNFGFTFDHLEYFRDQWEVLQVPRAPYYRVFRMNMLDDCGAMGAALQDVYRVRKDPRFLRMIRRIANYIGNVQLRLPDGTLSRPDPRFMTLWADDLYMSVPFLARMGAFSGERRYYDDAALQVVQFYGRLLNTPLSVLHHAWFSDTGERSVGLWGRANGWAIVATTELLAHLPVDHPKRDTVLRLYRLHLAGLASLQDSSGLWHQLLDRQDSYLETSCSAMFCYAAARGVNEGWIGRQYEDMCRRAWQGVVSRVRPDGQVEGICRGTEVGSDAEFYLNRPTPLNDPRGIGAVLLAGAEMVRLEPSKSLKQ
jgi:rhamnogalacturonyl hydrolase YesR